MVLFRKLQTLVHLRPRDFRNIAMIIFLNYRGNNWGKIFNQNRLKNFHSYLVQRISSCKLPWHRWHCVHRRVNFSSSALRWVISFWYKADSLGLQCWHTAAIKQDIKGSDKNFKIPMTCLWNYNSIIIIQIIHSSWYALIPQVLLACCDIRIGVCYLYTGTLSYNWLPKHSSEY